MEEPEEWNHGGYSSQICDKRSFMLQRGLKLGKKILVVGFVVYSAPVVLPSIMIVSAVGLTVSMPSVFFLASHAFTHKLMSKLLPRPTISSPLLFYPNGEEEKEKGEQERHGQQEVFFKGDIHMDQRNQELQEEKRGEIEMVKDIHNEENCITLGKDHEQGVLMKDETERSQDAIHVIEDHEPKEDNEYTLQVEKPLAKKPTDVKLEIGEDSKVEQPIIGGHGLVMTFEDLDKVSNAIDESEAPVENTSVAFEELGDQAIEGDIKGGVVDKGTKGLVEKHRDEGKKDNGVNYVREDDERISLVFDNSEIECEDDHKTIRRIKGEGSKDENLKANEGMLKSWHAQNMDAIDDEVESAHLVQAMPEENEADHGKGSQKPIAELCGLKNGGNVIYKPIPSELVEGMLNEGQNYSPLATEDSTDVTAEKNSTHTVEKKEQKSALDGPSILQEGRLEISIYKKINQEYQMHAYNEATSSSDAGSREIADQIYFEKCGYTFEIHGESSDTIIEEHIDAAEVPVSYAEHKSEQSEFSSGEDVASPFKEVVLNEEKLWKQIHAVRMIVGYEAMPKASCIDELKALYIFTGVEPPSLPSDSSDLAEINEKLHFLMSVVGVKLKAA